MREPTIGELSTYRTKLIVKEVFTDLKAYLIKNFSLNDDLEILLLDIDVNYEGDDEGGTYKFLDKVKVETNQGRFYSSYQRDYFGSDEIDEEDFYDNLDFNSSYDEDFEVRRDELSNLTHALLEESDALYWTAEAFKKVLDDPLKIVVLEESNETQQE